MYPAAAGAQTDACTPDPTWERPDELAAAELLVLINSHRESLGLGALEVSPALVDASGWKAAHMAATGLFAHEDPDRTMTQRVSDCGYPYRATENIGWGYLTPGDMLAAWLASDGHRAHIEDPNADDTGIAVVTSVAGVPYWVQVFGTRDDAAGAPEEPLPAPPPADTAPSDPAPSESAVIAPVPFVAPVSSGTYDESSWLHRGLRLWRRPRALIDPRH